MSNYQILRQEIHSLIDSIPERNLHAMRPTLNHFLEKDEDTLSDEEQELLSECQRDIVEHPDSFISIEEYKKARSCVLTPPVN